MKKIIVLSMVFLLTLGLHASNQEQQIILDTHYIVYLDRCDHDSADTIYMDVIDTQVGAVHTIIAGASVIVNKRFTTGDVCELNSLYVDQAYQGKKIGKKLVNLAVDYAKSKSCKILKVTSSHSAIGFYEKLGFIASHDFPDKLSLILSTK